MEILHGSRQPEVPARQGLRDTVVALDTEEQSLTVQTEAGNQIKKLLANCYLQSHDT